MNQGLIPSPWTDTTADDEPNEAIRVLKQCLEHKENETAHWAEEIGIRERKLNEAKNEHSRCLDAEIAYRKALEILDPTPPLPVWPVERVADGERGTIWVRPGSDGSAGSWYDAKELGLTADPEPARASSYRMVAWEHRFGVLEVCYSDEYRVIGGSQ